MSELQIFENPEFGQIRSVEVDGEPWLVGKDVAAALGYSDTAQAIRTHVDDEDKGVVEMTTPGGKQKIQIINESGLYSLILSSKLPGAKKFKRWVTSEVLPAIRKSGGYMAPTATAKALDDLTAAVQLLSEQVEELLAREDEELVPVLALPEGPSAGAQVPGIAARRRWMRTVNEKLDLLSMRLGSSHNTILHQIYQILEKKYQVALDEERMKAIETYDLGDCSVLTAIFYNETLRDGMQRTIDYNLAPENRGW